MRRLFWDLGRPWADCGVDGGRVSGALRNEDSGAV